MSRPLLGAVMLLACGAPGLTVSSGEPPSVPAGPVYAAFPPRNLTPEPGVGRALLDELYTSLSARGAGFVPSGDLELILRSRRIRYTDSVGVEAAQAIAEDTGASHILLASVLTWEPEPAPNIAVVLRVIDARNGRRVQSVAVSLRGEEFEGLLGLGSIETTEDLQREVMARVLDVFEADGSPRAQAPAGERASLDAPSDALSYYLRDGFDPSALGSVAVMPLTNRAAEPDAGLLFSDLLAHEWFQTAGVDIVERSELLAAMVREKVRSADGVDLETLARIGRSVGTRYFAMGSVDRYGDEVWVGSEFFPVCEVLVRVVDVEAGQVVIAGALRRRGDDYHRGLGLGMVRDSTALALLTARELVALLMIQP